METEVRVTFTRGGAERYSAGATFRVDSGHLYVTLPTADGQPVLRAIYAPGAWESVTERDLSAIERDLAGDPGKIRLTKVD